MIVDIFFEQNKLCEKKMIANSIFVTYPLHVLSFQGLSQKVTIKQITNAYRMILCHTVHNQMVSGNNKLLLMEFSVTFEVLNYPDRSNDHVDCFFFSPNVRRNWSEMNIGFEIVQMFYLISFFIYFIIYFLLEYSCD